LSARGCTQILCLLPLLAVFVAAPEKLQATSFKRPFAEAVLDYCVAYPAHCSISVEHLSGGWARHWNADRLNVLASSFKLIPLLVYSQAVADGRIDPERLVDREDWTRFWFGLDGGGLECAWDALGQPLQASVEQMANVMIWCSDNAVPDWFLHEFGDRSFQQVLDRFVTGHHDLPESIYAMFLTEFANPDEPGLDGTPTTGERAVAESSDFGSGRYRAELDRWFARLENPGFVSLVRNCNPFEPQPLPWSSADPCPIAPIRITTGPAQASLWSDYFTRSTTRAQTRLMMRLLSRDLLSDVAQERVERSLESPMSGYTRYGAKAGGLQVAFQAVIATWTAYLERSDGESAVVSVHLRAFTRDLVWERIDSLQPWYFADAIVEDPEFAELVRMTLPESDPRPELVALVERVEPLAEPGGERRADLEILVRNIGDVDAAVESKLDLFVRPSSEGFDPTVEVPSQTLTVPALLAGEEARLLFEIQVPDETPQESQYVFLVTDPDDRVAESTEMGAEPGEPNLQWERLAFPVVNHRSIGGARGPLAAGASASGSAGSLLVRVAPLPPQPVIGRGDRLVLDPGGPREEAHSLFALDREGNASLLRLQSPLQDDYGDASFTIERAFPTIQSWEDARQGDLAGENRLEVGVLYNDSPFTSGLDSGGVCAPEGSCPPIAVIEGSLTTRNHYMALEVADRARHDGTAGTGVLIQGGTDVGSGIRIEDAFTRVRGAELADFASGAAIEVGDARHVLLEDLLIHDADLGILGTEKADFVLRNSIVYSGSGAGVRLSAPSATALLENSTVVGMAGPGVDEDAGLLIARNTIAMGNAGSDFQIERGDQDHNLSSDSTASGEGSIVGGDPTEEFVALTSGAEDFNLQPEGSAVGAGTVLFPSFERDMVGVPRPRQGPWDLGPLVFVPEASRFLSASACVLAVVILCSSRRRKLP
jgi:hypothetical protein